MQNEFDDTIKKQVEGFALKPSTQIWERVKAQLPEKKRRRFIFWWLPAITILLGIGFYELGVQHGKLKNSINTDKNKIILNKKLNSIKVTKNELKNRNIIAIKTKSPLNKIEREQQFKSVNKIKKRILIDFKLAGITKSMSNNNQNNLNNGNLLNHKDEQIIKTNYLNTFEYSNKTDDSIKINSNLNSTTIKKIDSIIVENTKTDTAKLKNDTILSIAKKAIKPSKTLKIKWELTASIGSSNTVERAFSNGLSSNYNLANSISTPTSNPQPQASPLSIPNAGISFSIGLQSTQQINKKWRWYTSFQYAYLSNYQASGAFVDSSLTLANSQSNVSNYYKYGNTVEHLNQIHRFDVSTGLKYTFKINSSKPFSLYGGLIVGYQLNNWLQADAQQPVLYYSNTLTTKLIIGSRFGLDWQLGNQLSIGVFYEFAFTNASRSATQSPLHWQVFGAKLAVPFPFNKLTKPAHHKKRK